MLSIFSTRELASLLWILIVLVCCIIFRKVRIFILAILKFNFRRNMFLPSAILLVYCAAITILLSFLPFWNWKFAKDVSIWFIFIGLSMCKNALTLENTPQYFKTLLLDNFKLMVVVEFFINTFSFSFAAEVVLLPILTFVLFMNSSSKSNPLSGSSKATFILQFIIGLLILGYSLNVAIVSFRSLNGVEMLISFFLPIAFTVLSTPIAYIISLFDKYKLLFVRMGFRSPADEELRIWHQKVALQSCGLSLKRISSFYNLIVKQMDKAMTKDEFNNLVHEFNLNYNRQSEKRQPV